MRDRLAFASALMFIALTPSGAGEIENLAREAQSQAQAGQAVDAIETMRSAAISLWKSAGFGLRRPMFVTRKPGGFGLFEPRPTAAFNQGEPLLVYVEPVGFAWNKEGDGYRALIVADFEIRSADGNILGGRKNFGQFNIASKLQNTEFMADLTINLTGAPTGAYVLGLTFHDRIGSKSSNLDLPFEIK
jgi:hypothetical protein